MEVLFNETWCRLKWMDVLSNWESSCAASSVASFWCLPSATPALMLEPESTLMHLNLQRHTNTLTTKVQYWSWNQSCYFWTLTVDIFSPWRMKMLQHPSTELPLDFFHEIHFDIPQLRGADIVHAGSLLQQPRLQSNICYYFPSTVVMQLFRDGSTR